MAKVVNTISRETLQDLAKLYRTVAALAGIPLDNPSSKRLSLRPIRYAKITDSAQDGDVWKHAWTEQTWDADTNAFVDMPEGFEGTTSQDYLIRPTGSQLPDGKVVRVDRFDNPDGTAVFLEHRESGVFLVKLTKDGGDAGGSGTTCDWTYTVKDAEDTSIELATEAEPLAGRIAGVEYENESLTDGLDSGLATYVGDSLVLIAVLTEVPLFDENCGVGSGT